MNYRSIVTTVCSTGKTQKWCPMMKLIAVKKKGNERI